MTDQTTPAPGYSREGDIVVLRMAESDYLTLLVALGFATGSDSFDRTEMIQLVNRLNQGNPRYRPYAVPDKDAKSGYHQ